jgi:hypothetical protein
MDDKKPAPAGERATVNLWVPILVSVGALIIALAHASAPDLKIDEVTLGLIAIAVVPWLGHVVESLELPGGAKVKYRQLAERIDATDARVAKIDVKADQASTAAESASRQAATATVTAVSSVVRAPAAADTSAELATLIQEYETIRKDMKPGGERTEKMTNIVGRLIALAPHLTSFDTRKGLFSLRGERLAAYAYLYALPDGKLLEELVQSVSEPDPNHSPFFRARPFEQYWGILAIRKVLGSPGTAAASEDIRNELDALLHRLEPTTDRYIELSRIIHSLDNPGANAH